jgi:hypothetical protein
MSLLEPYRAMLTLSLVAVAASSPGFALYITRVYQERIYEAALSDWESEGGALAPLRAPSSV